MKYTLYACSKFWSDVKETRKSASKKALFETSLSEEQFASADIESKLDSIDILRAISTLVQNTFDEPKKVATPLGKQLFIDHGFTIYKLRYAADGRGQSAGLRIMYCLGKEGIIVFLCIKFKKAVEHEQKFEIETIQRMQEFLKVNFQKTT